MASSRQTFSRSRDDSAYYRPTDSAASPARSVRTQKSMADISSARSASSRREPQLPPPPLPRGVKSAATASVRSTRGHSSSTSTSSGSSFASSTFDGRKRSYDSNTSLEDERDYKPAREREKSRRPRERYQREEEREEEQAPTSAGASGPSIWNAISALTVNVSKAWDGGVNLADGEITPPGQESRLTKALKEYHIRTARSAKDLPAWLFDERELRGRRDEDTKPSSSSSSLRSRAWQDEEAPATAVPRSRGLGLRDIYEQTSASASPSTKSFDTTSTSKASSRLKALKDAKRAASGRPGGGYEEDAPAPVEVYDDYSSQREANETTSSRRLGLPTGPRRR